MTWLPLLILTLGGLSFTFVYCAFPAETEAAIQRFGDWLYARLDQADDDPDPDLEAYWKHTRP